MYRALAVTALLYAAVLVERPAYSADMIQSYERPLVHQYHVRPQRPVYVRQNLEECELLLVEYRSRYEPHREIVQVCHPPLNLSPVN